MVLSTIDLCTWSVLLSCIYIYIYKEELLVRCILSLGNGKVRSFLYITIVKDRLLGVSRYLGVKCWFRDYLNTFHCVWCYPELSISLPGIYRRQKFGPKQLFIHVNKYQLISGKPSLYGQLSMTMNIDNFFIPCIFRCIIIISCV